MNQQFAYKLQTLQARVSKLRSRVRRPYDAGQAEMWQELTAALEELQAAEQELRQQHEELAAAQTMLERRQRRYAELFDLAPDANLLTDGGGTILEANQHAATLLGVPKPLLTGRALQTFLSPVDQRFVSSQLAASAQGGPASSSEDDPSTRTFEVKLFPRDREAFDIEVRIGRLYWEEERSPFLLWTLRDITPKRQAEHAFLSSEERYRLLAENASDLISRHDQNGVFLYASPACRRLLGYSFDEIVGRSLYDLAHQDDLAELETTHQELLSGRKRHATCEYRLLHKSGTIYHVETALKTFTTPDGADGTGFIAVTRDVTVRKKAEEELQRSEEQLKAAIQEVMQDTSWFAQSVVEKLIESRKTPTKKVGLQFTRREQQVLERIAKGFTNVEIAQDLGIATQTVRNYVAAVYDKIGANTRAQAVVWARERGLVGP